MRSPRRQWGEGQSRDAPALSGGGGDPHPIAVPNMPGDGPHDDDAADEAGDGGHLTETDPNPCNGERRFQRVDQGVLGSRDHLATHGEKDQPEAELGGPGQEQLQHVRRRDLERHGERPDFDRTWQADRHAAGSIGVS